MSRRKQSPPGRFIAIASKFPWWLSVVLAIAAYVWLHSLATGGLATVAQLGELGALVSQDQLDSVVWVGQYALPFVLLLGAAMSAYGRVRERNLNGPMTIGPGQGALNQMSWKQFEAVVGEAFRRKGYTVVKTGAGPVGGADLVLKKADETFLVQCKQWRASKVGVNSVHELHRMMAEKGAVGGFAVTSGVFTDEAQAFAHDKNIDLMDGKALHRLTRRVNLPARLFRETLSVMTTGAPFCPECQGRMRKRRVKDGADAGKEFWRCMRHPECKGKRLS